MRSGVPFHVAFGMPEGEAARLKLDFAERAAMAIILTEFEGGEFNWRTMSWVERK